MESMGHGIDLQEHNRAEWTQAIQRGRICRECCKIKTMNAEDSRENMAVK